MLTVVAAPSILLCVVGLLIAMNLDADVSHRNNGWWLFGAGVTWAALCCSRNFTISTTGENNLSAICLLQRLMLSQLLDDTSAKVTWPDTAMISRAVAPASASCVHAALRRP